MVCIHHDTDDTRVEVSSTCTTGARPSTTRSPAMKGFPPTHPHQIARGEWWTHLNGDHAGAAYTCRQPVIRPIHRHETPDYPVGTLAHSGGG